MARRYNVPKDKAIGINVGGPLRQPSIIYSNNVHVTQVRSLMNIDLASLEVEPFKGADLDPPYQPPKPSHGPRDGEDGLKIYDGNCHCGVVSYTVQSKPLSDIGVLSCNCSLCSRVRTFSFLFHLKLRTHSERRPLDLPQESSRGCSRLG
jgi:hypothetical protein